jgi:hypothetical protein
MQRKNVGIGHIPRDGTPAACVKKVVRSVSRHGVFAFCVNTPLQSAIATSA